MPENTVDNNKDWLSIADSLPSPSYVIDIYRIRKNCQILSDIAQKTNCKVLLALKAFAVYPFFNFISPYLHGFAASSLNEARLGAEYFHKEVHVYSPGYTYTTLVQLARYASHLVLNSFQQLLRFQSFFDEHPELKIGIRLNPQHSEVTTELYDPCRKKSRLGVTPDQFKPDMLDKLTGFHLHTLCEKDFDALKRTWDVFEKHFGKYLSKVKWLNLGGGHHITKDNYDRDSLINLLKDINKRYNVEIYLEPGEAVVLNCGVFITEVLDIIYNEGNIAILDSSASAHLVDVIEMPYLPSIIGAGKPNEYQYNYVLGGISCLAGDIFGEYSFPQPLKIGQRLVMLDMAHYTIVKNNTFNGISLPPIVMYDSSTGKSEIIREFDYTDFKSRLG